MTSTVQKVSGVEELCQRAEAATKKLKRQKVLKFELERAAIRKEYGYAPVPVTPRGRQVLVDGGYTVSDDGCLIL